MIEEQMDRRLEFEYARWRRFLRKMDDAQKKGNSIEAASFLAEAIRAFDEIEELEDRGARLP
jgi:hypothetical protein